MNGLLLVNLGSPKTPTTKDVKKYLRQFLGDQNVVTLPKWFWQPILNGFVLPLRSWRSATFYQDEWTKNGSPLIYNTQLLAKRVQNLLPDWKVEVAMTYGEPTIKNQLKKLSRRCNQIIVMSLFPQYTLSTTKSIIEQVEESKIACQIIDRFYKEESYQKAFTKHIQDAWNKKKYDQLFISYHGIPSREVKHGDPYLEECKEATQDFINLLDIPPEKIKMVFQSKFGPMPWLKPYLKNSLLEAVQMGKRNILIAAPSFVTDCLETIEEDYVQNYQSFRENGGDQLDLVNPLNDDPAFCQFIADLAKKRAKNAKNKSLDEINASVKVPSVYESHFWKKFLAYSGPGALVAVGYMDPGNWLTSLAGGSKFRYQLLSVLFISILIAMFMQSLSIKLGVVSRLDLAQATAKKVKKPIRYLLWLLNELAMMATDLTGVIGTALALKMLFNLPLIFGVLLTILDVFVVLWFMRFGIRRIEFIVVLSILLVGIIFAIEVNHVHPATNEIMKGFLPSISILTNHEKLLLSLSIIGATIMPHNLYLHSALAQSRRYNYRDPKQVDETLRFANWDSIVHLIMALIINSLLLILGGTIFFNHSGNLTSLMKVFLGLKNAQIVGNLASPIMSYLFAFALLVTGLISSITSTLSGQIVMEGYLHIRLPLWKRRLLTRFITLIPILFIGFLVNFNEEIFEKMIVNAQIVLSITLPFVLFPLVFLTANKQQMGNLVNKKWQTFLGLILSLIITILNIMLIVSTL